MSLFQNFIRGNKHKRSYLALFVYYGHVQLAPQQITETSAGYHVDPCFLFFYL